MWDAVKSLSFLTRNICFCASGAGFRDAWALCPGAPRARLPGGAADGYSLADLRAAAKAAMAEGEQGPGVAWGGVASLSAPLQRPLGTGRTDTRGGGSASPFPRD